MSSDLPAEFAKRWEPVTTLTDDRSVFVVSIAAETTVYGPTDEPNPAIFEGSIPIRSLFIVDLEFSPSLPSVGVSPAGIVSMAAPKAKNSFVDAVADKGLVVDGVRETIAFERDGGAPGKWYVLDAGYPLSNSNADRLTAEAHVVVWPTDRSFGVVGGTLPLEAGDGFDADPERDRERIARLARTVDDASTDGGDTADRSS